MQILIYAKALAFWNIASANCNIPDRAFNAYQYRIYEPISAPAISTSLDFRDLVNDVYRFMSKHSSDH